MTDEWNVVYVRYIDEQVPIRYDGAVFPNLGCSNCWLKESGFCCPGYVRLIWSCGTGIRVFLKIISVSCSYKGVPMLHAHRQPRHAHSSQYLHCPLAWETTTQSHTSAKLWVWSSPYDQESALWHWVSLARASPTCSLDDATDGCVVWWRVPGPQQV